MTLKTATAIVIANMIGTGVFTSLGFQVLGIQSGFSLLMLWIIGGIIALAGALSYGELAAMFPRSGGEYNYLSKIYHPILGFLSGWISISVGFSAPVAAAAVALGTYVNSVYPNVNGTILAVSIVILTTLLHAWDLKKGAQFQNISTLAKVILIALFIIAGFILIDTPQNLSFLPQKKESDSLFSSAFAISLIYVSYAYSGWNASAYLAGEIENPKKNVPRSLFIGTLIVMVIYALLNFIFLYTVPISELAGQVEIGYLAADKIFGESLGKIMGLFIAAILVSSISSMIIAGPRVTQVIGEDIKLLSFFAKKTKKGVPAIAIIFQSIISIIFILSAQFDVIIRYIGFTLSLFTFLTVLGVFVMRIREPKKERSYKVWGYPITPLIFLSLSLWTIIYLIKDKPEESLYGFATVFIGFIIWLIDKALKK